MVIDRIDQFLLVAVADLIDTSVAIDGIDRFLLIAVAESINTSVVIRCSRLLPILGGIDSQPELEYISTG